jgi:hypothetical protein
VWQAINAQQTLEVHSRTTEAVEGVLSRAHTSSRRWQHRRRRSAASSVMPPAAAAAEEKDAGLLLGWARGVTAALLVMMRKMMCGRQSGAYVVFGGEEQEEGRSSLAAKVLGPRLQLFHDTNDLLVRTLFSKSDLAPATSSFQQVTVHAP